jgi:hypothetical protein
VAYFGDVIGNGGYSGLDAQRVARVGVGLDSGFAAYPHIDPVVLADITGNGKLSGLDAQRIALVAAGADTPEIPPIPQPLRLDNGTPGSRSRQTSGNEQANTQTSGVGDQTTLQDNENHEWSPTPEVFSKERLTAPLAATFASFEFIAPGERRELKALPRRCAGNRVDSLTTVLYESLPTVPRRTRAEENRYLDENVNDRRAEVIDLLFADEMQYDPLAEGHRHRSLGQVSAPPQERRRS